MTGTMFNTLLAAAADVTVETPIDGSTGVWIKQGATVISSGMKMVGAIMVSGLIIFPALSAMRVAKRFRSVMITSAALSLGCFFLGFFLSLLIEAQPGPAIIAVHVLAFLICCLIGFLRTRIRTRKARGIVVEPPCRMA